MFRKKYKKQNSWQEMKKQTSTFSKFIFLKKSIFMLTPNVPSIAKFSVGKFASLESFFVF